MTGLLSNISSYNIISLKYENLYNSIQPRMKYIIIITLMLHLYHNL